MMRTVKTWDGKGAREIIEGKTGVTNGMHNLTGDIIWQFRTDYNIDGSFDTQGPCVCDESGADCITVESFEHGIIARLDI